MRVYQRVHQSSGASNWVLLRMARIESLYSWLCARGVLSMSWRSDLRIFLGTWIVCQQQTGSGLPHKPIGSGSDMCAPERTGPSFFRGCRVKLRLEPRPFSQNLEMPI